MIARSPLTPTSTPAATAGWTGTGLCWGLIIALDVIALLLTDLGSVDTALSLGIVASTASVTWLFVVAYRRTRNALDPICLSAICLFLLYPFHGAVTQGSIAQLELIGSDSNLWLLYALMVQVVSVPFLWLGFGSRLGARIMGALWSPRWRIDDGASATLVKLLVVWVLAFIARALLLDSGAAYHFGPGAETDQLQGFQFALSEIAKLPVFVCAFILVHGLRTKRRELILLAAGLVLVELGWGLVSGSRARVFFPMISLLAAATYAYRRLRPRTMLLGVAVFTLIILPFATAFRTAYFGRADEVHRDGFDVGIIASSLAEASDDDDSSALDIGDGPIADLAERMHGLSSLALIMRFTPERRDYTWGETLVSVPLSLVPSLVWPDKPPVSRLSDDFRYVYWGATPGDQTSVAPSQLGHLWSELHLPGVMLGTLLFGLVLGVVFRHARFGVVGDTIFPSIVVACVLPYLLHSWESPLDGALAGLPKTLLIYILVGWFLSVSRNRPRAFVS